MCTFLKLHLTSLAMQSFRTDTHKGSITFFSLDASRGEDKKLSTCNIFSEIAKETWERFHFAYEKKGFKIYETTITQNILYKIEKIRRYLDVNIILREAVDEKTNGNDIEFVITDGTRSLKMPMQAKRVQKNLRYSSISHKGQIESLINYAKKVKGIPMYLLYNYNRNFIRKFKLCSIESDERQYGCSIIDAIYIQENFTSKFGSSIKWSIPKFKDLVPKPSIPWIVIPCCLTDSFGRIEDIFDVLNIESNIRKDLEYVDFHDHEEVMDENIWKELDLFENVEGRFPKEDGSEGFENEFYKPGYQILVNIG